MARSKALLIIFAALTLAGCERCSCEPSAKAGNRRIPGAAGSPFTLTVEVQPFLAAGCVQKAHSSLDCTKAEAIPRVEGEGRFSGKVLCNSQLEIDHQLGGLAPRVAIGVCHTPAKTDIAMLGCMAPIHRQFIVHDEGNDEFVVLNSRQAFRERFAPVDSPVEAFSFAVALTTGEPDYELEVPKDTKILVAELDATFVKQVDGGYLVRLFEQAHCGCGNHETSAYDYLVTRDGHVTEQKSVKVYDEPDDDGLCVD